MWHITHVEESWVQSLLSRWSLIIYLPSMLALPTKAIPSNWPANRSGTLNTVIFHIKFITDLLDLFVLANYICGLDFNPTGESVATIDATGVCLISDINTDSYSFHQQIGTKAGNFLNFEANSLFLYCYLDGYAHCRWSTESSEPLLYVKYEGNKLNILDIEKKARTLPDSILINKPGCKITVASFFLI